MYTVIIVVSMVLSIACIFGAVFAFLELESVKVGLLFILGIIAGFSIGAAVISYTSPEYTLRECQESKRCKVKKVTAVDLCNTLSNDCYTLKLDKPLEDDTW